MQIDKLYEALGLLAEQCKRVVQASMEKNGVNDKINVNTLIDSHLYEEIDTESDLEMVRFMVNDYYQYVESGMRPGHWVNEEYLIPWMQDKGISTDNNTLYNIQYSIYKWGISPRPFMEDAFEMIDDYFDEFADKVIEILLEDVVDWFSN